MPFLTSADNWVQPSYHFNYNPITNTTAATTYTIPLYNNYTPITSTTTNWTYNSGYGRYQPSFNVSDIDETYRWRYQPQIVTTGNTYQEEIWQAWVAMTDEQRVAMDRQILEGNERHQSACVRARTLLGEFLSEEQKGELERDGRFHVTGSRGRRYCIRAYGQAGNVDLLRPDGAVQATLCAHPGSYLPDGDAWLMQMIELRHDEDHFLQTANVHRGSLAGVA